MYYKCVLWDKCVLHTCLIWPPNGNAPASDVLFHLFKLWSQSVSIHLGCLKRSLDHHLLNHLARRSIVRLLSKPQLKRHLMTSFRFIFPEELVTTALKHLGGSILEVNKCMQGAISSLLLSLKTIFRKFLSRPSWSLKVINILGPAEAVGRLESEKAAIHAEYEQVHIFKIKEFVLSPVH